MVGESEPYLVNAQGKGWISNIYTYRNLAQTEGEWVNRSVTVWDEVDIANKSAFFGHPNYISNETAYKNGWFVDGETGRVTKRVPRAVIERIKKRHTLLEDEEHTYRVANMDEAPVGAVIGIWHEADWNCPKGTSFCSRSWRSREKVATESTALSNWVVPSDALAGWGSGVKGIQQVYKIDEKATNSSCNWCQGTWLSTQWLENRFGWMTNEYQYLDYLAEAGVSKFRTVNMNPEYTPPN